jgi:hypothetical protein
MPRMPRTGGKSSNSPLRFPFHLLARRRICCLDAAGEPRSVDDADGPLNREVETMGALFALGGVVGWFFVHPILAGGAPGGSGGPAIPPARIAALVGCGSLLEVFPFLLDRRRGRRGRRRPPRARKRRGAMLSWPSDGLPASCPRGHGPLDPWRGGMRCWSCGWPRGGPAPVADRPGDFPMR